jgi:glycosyltransferase involved in cell wall biosynthesis
MLRVVMSGPRPPSIGGMATVIDDVARSSLGRNVELILFDTGKRTPAGRSLGQAIRARLAIWRAWWQALAPAERTIAHIHTCSGLTYFLDGTFALLARVRGVPVVLHIHGARFDVFLDGLNRPTRWLARRIAKLAARVVVLSGEWQQKMSTRLPGAKLTIIENGVAEPPPIAAEKVADEITVLFLGNLCQRKGVWDLLACAGQLPPGVRVALVGGEEDPGIAAQVQQYLERENLKQRIEMVGPAVGEAKFRWLRKADIFVLPSYAEGVPISMLEALAAGLPVIVTPVGGIPSVLEEGIHALFVSPGDRTALAGAIARLASDPSLRGRLGTAGRQHVVERYGVEHSAQKYLRLYESIKGQSGGTAGEDICPPNKVQIGSDARSNSVPGVIR